jgi:phosphoribosylglycinamide formyltransferase-1
MKYKGEPMEGKVKIGVLVSGGGSNLQAILDGCGSGMIEGDVVFVGADNPDAGGLLRAEKHGIPTFVVDYADIIQSFLEDPLQLRLPHDFQEQAIRSKLQGIPGNQDEMHLSSFLKTRAVAEAQLLENIEQFSFDLLVLAGFMRALTPYFIDKVNTRPAEPRIMNIHPALLPAFPGVDGYGDTFRYGCKVAGCTVHFIDYGEDSGPIIAQSAFEIEETDTLESIRAKGLKREWALYPTCIQQFAKGRLKTEQAVFTLKNGKQTSRTIVRILSGDDTDPTARVFSA